MNRAPGSVVQPVVVSSPALMARDVFVHYSEIDGYGFRSLMENRHVEFEVIKGLGPAGHHVRAA